MKKEKLLISACLLGKNCKYSGGNNGLSGEVISRLREKYSLVAVCPETAGGLPIPREPSERVGERVLSRSGRDVTPEYRKGAEVTAELAVRFLDDYLRGDLYFKTSYPAHNLVRARNQIALCRSMEAHMDEMNAIVHRCAEV